MFIFFISAFHCMYNCIVLMSPIVELSREFPWSFEWVLLVFFLFLYIDRNQLLKFVDKIKKKDWFSSIDQILEIVLVCWNFSSSFSLLSVFFSLNIIYNYASLNTHIVRTMVVVTASFLFRWCIGWNSNWFVVETVCFVCFFFLCDARYICHL